MRISDWSSDVCSFDLDKKARNCYCWESLIPALLHGTSRQRIKGISRQHALGRVPDFEHTLPTLVPTYGGRSEEHTSELQSLMRISYAVFCLKKKKNKYSPKNISRT